MIRISTFEATPHYPKFISRKRQKRDVRASNIARNKYYKLDQEQVKQLTSIKGKSFGELFFPLFYKIPSSQRFIDSRAAQGRRSYSTKTTRTTMDPPPFSRENLNFEEARSDQLELLQSWLKKPHVSKFWGDGGMTIPDFLKFTSGESSVFKHYFGFHDHRPIVFMMTSIVEEGEDYEKWSEKSGTNLILDIMIGDENFVGKGYGHLILEEFFEQKCQDAAAILIEPELKNQQAIRVYEKAGFKPQGIYIPEEGGWAGIEHLIMKKVMDKA